MTSHEWAYIDTRVAFGHRAKVQRCMHCRAERVGFARPTQICLGPITKILYVPPLRPDGTLLP